MSFDLAVWYESAPITLEAAEAKLGAVFEHGDVSAFEPSEKVAQFWDDLLDRFPDTGDESEVWSVPLERSDRVVHLCVVWPQADRVTETVRQLANEHGLVCWNPLAGAIDPNVPGYVPAFVLTTEVYPRVPDPSADRLERAVSKLSNDNFFAIVERADAWYAQVGYGEKAGAKPGTYAMEYREGAPDEHYRAETPDRVAATRFLQEFLEGRGTYKKRHAWRHLEL